MGKNLFIISTPSQAFFLRQSPEFIENAVLVLTVPDAVQEKKILYYLREFDWQSVYILKRTRAGFSSYSYILYFRIWLFLFKKKYPFFKKIFIGSYNNHHHTAIVGEYEDKAQIYLLSDGMQMIAVSTLRKSGENSVREFPSFFRLLKFRHPGIVHLNFISPMEIEVGEWDRVYLLDKRNNNLTPKLRKDLIYFAGQPLSEMGILSTEFYLSSLRELQSLYAEKKIIYLPHPTERSENLSEIGEMMEIKVLPHIFEEEYLSSKEFPATVVSFYSSVLINLCFMQAEVDLIAVSIPDEEIIPRDLVPKIKIIYNFLENLDVGNLKIIKIADA